MITFSIDAIDVFARDRTASGSGSYAEPVLAFVVIAADMDGAVIAVFRIEAEEAQPRLAGAGARIEEDRRHVEFALELGFDRTDPQIRVERLQIRNQHNRLGCLPSSAREQCFKPLLELSLRGQRIRQRPDWSLPNRAAFLRSAASQNGRIGAVANISPTCSAIEKISTCQPSLRRSRCPARHQALDLQDVARVEHQIEDWLVAGIGELAAASTRRISSSKSALSEDMGELLHAVVFPADLGDGRRRLHNYFTAQSEAFQFLQHICQFQTKKAPLGMMYDGAVA